MRLPFLPQAAAARTCLLQRQCKLQYTCDEVSLSLKILHLNTPSVCSAGIQRRGQDDSETRVSP
jgi:hypothetical protein